MNKTNGRNGTEPAGRADTLGADRAAARPAHGDLDEFEKFFREQFAVPGIVPPPAVQPAPAPPVAVRPVQSAPVQPAPAMQPAGVDDPLMAELARIVGQDVRPSAQPAPRLPATHDPFAPAQAVSEADSLRAFEEELRRFDAEQRDRAAQQFAPSATASAAPAEPYHDADFGPLPGENDLRGTSDLRGTNDLRGTIAGGPEGAPPLPGDEMSPIPPILPPEPQPRSRKVMIMLSLAAAIAVAGVVGTFGFGRSGSTTTASGQPPVISARQGPTKERPANPGGLEISGQDRQVLTPKTEMPKGAATVVNREEQPVDLNQTPKRETPRVVLPAPNGTAGAPGAPNPPVPILMPSGTSAPSSTASNAASSNGAGPAGLEPRRVRSVRISGEGDPITTPPAPTTQIAAVPAPVPTPPPAVRAPAEPAAAPKSDARPNTATTRTTPPPAQTTTPPARPQQQAARTTSDSTDGPLSLRPPSGAAARAPAPAATSGGSGGYAVQFKASPSEEDARATATSVRSRFSQQLGGMTPGVREATVNGRTVYRVRVGGLSQQAAASMCDRIKSGGGSCFVARN